MRDHWKCDGPQDKEGTEREKKKTKKMNRERGLLDWKREVRLG